MAMNPSTYTAKQTEAEKSRILDQVSKSYLDYFSASSFRFLTDTTGSVNVKCRQVGQNEIQVIVPNNYTVSTTFQS